MSNKRSIKRKKEKDTITKLIDETVKSNNMKVSKEQKDLMVQIFKFIIVGGIATLIDWIIYFICCRFIHIEPMISNVIAFTISVIYNYWASCKYVFNVTNKDSKLHQFIVFIVLAVIGLGITELILFILYHKVGWNYMLVKILATAIVMVFNFITRKIYLEKK